MTVVVTFKPGSGGEGKPTPSPVRITRVIAIMKLAYSVKIVTQTNRVHSFENSDVENYFVSEIKDGRM